MRIRFLSLEVFISNVKPSNGNGGLLSLLAILVIHYIFDFRFIPNKKIYVVLIDMYLQYKYIKNIMFLYINIILYIIR